MSFLLSILAHETYFHRNLPHKSRGFLTHSTLKVVYDGESGKEVAGTMHVPGLKKALDLWHTVGYKWATKNVDTDFVPWGFVECQIPVKATGGTSRLVM